MGSRPDESAPDTAAESVRAGAYARAADALLELAEVHETLAELWTLLRAVERGREGSVAPDRLLAASARLEALVQEAAGKLLRAGASIVLLREMAQRFLDLCPPEE